MSVLLEHFFCALLQSFGLMFFFSCVCVWWCLPMLRLHGYHTHGQGRLHLGSRRLGRLVRGAPPLIPPSFNNYIIIRRSKSRTERTSMPSHTVRLTEHPKRRAQVQGRPRASRAHAQGVPRKVLHWPGVVVLTCKKEDPLAPVSLSVHEKS